MISAASQRLPDAPRPSSADHIRSVPLDRWDSDSLAAPGLGARFGGFVAEWAHFDASLFGISPSEAAVLDPQQRVLLEVQPWLPTPRQQCVPVVTLIGRCLHD